MPVNTNFPPLTVENYKLLPETGPRYQLIQGDLYMAPAPNRFHQEISRNLQFELHSYLKRNPIRQVNQKETLSTELLPGFYLAVATIFER